MRDFVFLLKVYFCLCFAFTILPLRVNGNPETCQTPEQNSGRCVEIKNCPPLFNLSQQIPLSVDNVLYLTLLECGDGGSKVCCEEENKSPQSFGSRGKFDDVCNTPEGQSGECIILDRCPPLHSLLKFRPFTPEKANTLRKACCGFEGIKTKVCCFSAGENEAITRASDPMLTGPITSALLPNFEKCGLIAYNRIKGGKVAEIDEFPWMSLLEYQTPKGKQFNCGGSLINNRYVLTAAHCVAGKELPSDWTLISVRLGEYDTNNKTDCAIANEMKFCSAPPIDVAIEKQIVHEQYRPDDRNRYHDIALLRLEKEISFTDYVKPICIPTTVDLLRKTYVGEDLTVAGWGQTENNIRSNILLKLDVTMKPLRDCSAVYGGRATLGASQLCAGGEMDQDSCKGDSGGPLMVVDQTSGFLNYYVAGVVSFGPNPCGLERWPGVYTKVGQYVPWIVSNLKP